MKAISESTLEVLEDVALAGARELKAFFAYQGNDASYYRKARVAATAISGYARIRASETNRMAVELAVQRMAEVELPALPDRSNEDAIQENAQV